MNKLNLRKFLINKSIESSLESLLKIKYFGIFVLSLFRMIEQVVLSFRDNFLDNFQNFALLVFRIINYYIVVLYRYEILIERICVSETVNVSVIQNTFLRLYYKIRHHDSLELLFPCCQR